MKHGSSVGADNVIESAERGAPHLSPLEVIGRKTGHQTPDTARYGAAFAELQGTCTCYLGKLDPRSVHGSFHRRNMMPDHVYRIIQVAGSSEKSLEDAIQTAVARASSTLRQIGWFEVVETRGHVEDGKVAHYQVTLKIGFTLDDD
jgi:dodecin